MSYRYGSGGAARVAPPRESDSDDEYEYSSAPNGVPRHDTQSARNASIAENKDTANSKVRRTQSIPNAVKVTAADLKTRGKHGNTHRDYIVPPPQKDLRRSLASSSNSNPNSSRAESLPYATRGEPDRKVSIQQNPGYDNVEDNQRQRYQMDRRATHDPNHGLYDNREALPISSLNYDDFSYHNTWNNSNAQNSMGSVENMCANMNMRTRTDRTQSHVEENFIQQRSATRPNQLDRQTEQQEQISPRTFTEGLIYDRREGSISPSNQNWTHGVLDNRYSGKYSSDSASYNGQSTQFEKGTNDVNYPMHNLGLGDQDRARHEYVNWDTQSFNMPPLQRRSTTSAYTTQERPGHNEDERRAQARDSGYAEQHTSTISSARESLSVQTNPYQSEASIWQDGHNSAYKLHCRILKLDTQCEKSNWVSARLVNDLGASTEALEYPQEFKSASGDIMKADLVTNLTFRFHGQDAAQPRTRFYVAAATDLSFDIILGQEDSRNYNLLSLPNFHAIAHQKQSPEEIAEEAQRIAAINKMKQEVARRTAEEKAAKKMQTSHKSSQGESSRDPRRDEDRGYDKNDRGESSRKTKRDKDKGGGYDSFPRRR